MATAVGTTVMAVGGGDGGDGGGGGGDKFLTTVAVSSTTAAAAVGPVAVRAAASITGAAVAVTSKVCVPDACYLSGRNASPISPDSEGPVTARNCPTTRAALEAAHFGLLVF